MCCQEGAAPRAEVAELEARSVFCKGAETETFRTKLEALKISRKDAAESALARKVLPVKHAEEFVCARMAGLSAASVPVVCINAPSRVRAL